MNNITHPAIPKIIIDFFYSREKCLASLFPETFSHTVPLNTIGLVMTVVHSSSKPCNIPVNTDPLYQIQNSLKEWLLLGYKKVTVPFHGDNYHHVFMAMMTAIDQIRGNPYHCAKFEANHTKWAHMGMYESAAN